MAGPRLAHRQRLHRPGRGRSDRQRDRRIRIEDNEVRDSTGASWSSPRTPPTITEQLGSLTDPLQDILQDALIQVGATLVMGYPLPTAFVNTSAISELPTVQARLSPTGFTNLPLLIAFDILLQFFNASCRSAPRASSNHKD